MGPLMSHRYEFGDVAVVRYFSLPMVNGVSARPSWTEGILLRSIVPDAYLRKRWKKVLLCSALCLLCSFLFVTPVRASRAAKYQGSAAQRLLTAPESVSRFWVRLSETAVLQAAVQRSAI